MKVTEPHPYYVIWSGALNLGDTPGVFMDAQFVGLLLQIPLTLTYVPPAAELVELMLITSDVEIFNGKKHPVYWDWVPGNPPPAPVGYIDDTSHIPGKPEYHVLSIAKPTATEGAHSITIQCNPEIAAGLRDDFVLKRIEAHDSIGAKLGWS